MRTFLRSVAILLVTAFPVTAQTFSSGSTGADGALDVGTMGCNPCAIPLPESGVFNFTTVNVPAGYTLTFKNNVANTPVVMLAQGAVTIAGTISVSSPSQEPGPGGYRGGVMGHAGLGPGGGQVSDSRTVCDGRWVGPLSLVPIVGGSGAAGCFGWPGSGGAGAILIASSTSITVTGAIVALPYGYQYMATGSGGAIRLVANSVVCSGTIHAYGGGPGIIRLEAPSGALTFTGTANPAPVLSLINPQVLPATVPSLSIVSIAGYPMPARTGTRYDIADIVLPNTHPDPIDVVVSGVNIPVGSTVDVVFGTTTTASYVPGTLTGTAESSTATVHISGLARDNMTYFFVTVTFDVPTVAAGGDARPRDVAKARVTVGPGGEPQWTFLRNDGSVVDPNLLPASFLSRFGL